MRQPPVEQGHHVAGETKSVHFQQHLAGEEADEEEVGVLLEVVEPERLVVVLGGKDAGVEEDQDDDQPEHPLRLADLTSLTTHLTIPPGKEPINPLCSVDGSLTFRSFSFVSAKLSVACVVAVSVSLLLL